MSLCAYIQTKDAITIGADTAVTLHIDGQYYRSSNRFEKLSQVGDYLVFVSGTIASSVHVVHDMQREERKTIGRLQRIIKRWGERLAHDDPDYVARVGKDAGSGGSLISAVIFRVLPEGGTVSYGICSSKGYSIEEFVVSDDGIRLSACGYSSDVATQHLFDLYFAGNRDPRKMITEVFHRVSGTNIGGDLVTYEMSRQGTSRYPDEKIPETLAYTVYQQEPFFVSNGSLTAGTITGITINGNTMTGNVINGGVITGALLQTDSEGSYPRAYMSNTTKMFGVSSSATSGIELRSFGSPSATSSIRLYAAGSEAGIAFPNASTGMYLSGPALTAEFDRIYLRGYNGVSVLNWSSLRSEADNQTLQSALSSKATAGASTGLSQTFNAGIPIGTQLAVAGGGFVTWAGIPAHTHPQV
jgi:hypothetical protein